MRTKAFEGHKGEGAREWSSLSYNICVGCQHDCLYCYAKLRGSQRDPKLNQAGVWKNQRLNANRPKLGVELRKPGVVMFPTTHDIVPDFLPQAVTTLKNLLKRHQVLVVSKTHLAVVQTLCRELADYKQALLFRFTIGSLDSSICSFWEPEAPDPTERFAAKPLHRFGLQSQGAVLFRRPDPDRYVGRKGPRACRAR